MERDAFHVCLVQYLQSVSFSLPICISNCTRSWQTLIFGFICMNCSRWVSVGRCLRSPAVLESCVLTEKLLVFLYAWKGGLLLLPSAWWKWQACVGAILLHAAGGGSHAQLLSYESIPTYRKSSMWQGSWTTTFLLNWISFLYDRTLFQLAPAVWNGTTYMWNCPHACPSSHK